ncbi:MAG TPA: ABC transporter permease subunit, partial [Ideonella sp.]|nr:ABC transporter permease subunit [Ideonella sp.]
MRWPPLFSPLAVLGALIALWAVATHAGWVPLAYAPTPDAALRALVRGYAQGDWWRLTGHTVWRTLQGWGIASVLGIALGALVGSSARLSAWLQPTLETLRPLPAPALIPLAVALWGLTPAMVLAVVVAGSIWPALLATTQGFAGVDPRLRDLRRLLHLRPAAWLLKIALPAALPDVLAGLRVGLTLALVIATVGEMLASMPGIGHALLLAARSFQAPELFAGMAVLGLLGFSGNAVLLALE